MMNPKFATSLMELEVTLRYDSYALQQSFSFLQKTQENLNNILPLANNKFNLNIKFIPLANNILQTLGSCYI